MNSNTRFVAVTLGITLVAAIAAALGAGVAQSRLAAPTTVAVIDIDRLSTSLEEFKVPREQFISKQNTWTEELKGLQTRLASLDEELELIPEDNMDARINKVIQRTTVESEIKTKSQLFQQASDLEQVREFVRGRRAVIVDELDTIGLGWDADPRDPPCLDPVGTVDLVFQAQVGGQIPWVAGSSTLTLSLDDLPTGWYILQLRDEQGRLLGTAKLVKR